MRENVTLKFEVVESQKDNLHVGTVLTVQSMRTNEFNGEQIMSCSTDRKVEHRVEDTTIQLKRPVTRDEWIMPSADKSMGDNVTLERKR